MKRNAVQIDNRNHDADEKLDRVLRVVAIFLILCLMSGFFIKILFF